MGAIYLTFKITSGPLPLARGGLGWGPLEARSRLKMNEWVESSRIGAIATS
ncbi:hypothetical protein NG799_23965 [Laspinema sp. D1]|uniref:Uncharacterized protein n=1 Tax=Laspinema palackyanum D2a TaxID=2953684 RepID=A0ABT2MXW9_9CYAN|nr:hypothetical protein [Laspinema sp. D2a]